jgi:hypothetical protein
MSIHHNYVAMRGIETVYCLQLIHKEWTRHRDQLLKKRRMRRIVQRLSENNNREEENV